MSRFLVLGSAGFPVVAYCFQASMLRFAGLDASSIQWWCEVVLCTTLLLCVESLYFLTAFTSPGVPNGVGVKSIRSTVGTQDKQCRKCEALKPPRTHHCSTCARCVLRMDHHCPFVNSCIGLMNLRFFVLWILSVALGAFYAALRSKDPFFCCFWDRRGLVTESLLAHNCAALGDAVLGFVVSLCVFAVMVLLGTWHLILIALDRTTIEFYRHTVQPVLQGEAVNLKPAPRGSLKNNFELVFFPTVERFQSLSLMRDEPTSEILVTTDGCVHRMRTETTASADAHV